MGRYLEWKAWATPIRDLALSLACMSGFFGCASSTPPTPGAATASPVEQLAELCCVCLAEHQTVAGQPCMQESAALCTKDLAAGSLVTVNTQCATSKCGGSCLGVFGNPKDGCLSWAMCSSDPQANKLACTGPTPWFEQTLDCYKAGACIDMWSKSDCNAMSMMCSPYIKSCSSSIPACADGYAPAKNSAETCCPVSNPYFCPDKLCHQANTCT